MKRNIITIMMALAALLMAQCKKQTEQQANEPAGATMDVTVRVQGNTEKTDITSTGVVTWKQGDKLYVVGEDQGLLGYVSARADGDPVTFTGMITALTSAQTLRFYYVGAREFTLDGSGNCTFDISGQDGSLAGIAAHNQLAFGKTTGTIAVGTIDFGTITMTSLMSIAHLNINDGGAAVSGPVTVTGGFATSTFDAKTYGGTALTGTAGDITMTFASGTASTDCYLALLPGTQTLKFSADGKEATLSEKDIAANTFYNSGSAIAVAMTAPTHEYVDLGLPSGLLWATCNLGAEHPYDYGDYYAWGEILPYYADGYSRESPCTHWRESMTTGAGNTDITNGYAWETYSQGGSSSFAEWTTPPYDATTKILKSAYDAATQEWGSDWRMPTGGADGEWQELASNTYMEWVYDYDGTGVPGFIVYKVKDAADKGLFTVDEQMDPEDPDWCTYNQDWDEVELEGEYSLSEVHLFLPAAGYRDGPWFYNVGLNGKYWSSSYYGSRLAYHMFFDSGSVGPQSTYLRYDGYSVRLVSEN